MLELSVKKFCKFKRNIFRSGCNLIKRARDHGSAHIEAENHRMAEQEITKSRVVP